jgi:adenylate cyclase
MIKASLSKIYGTRHKLPDEVEQKFDKRALGPRLVILAVLMVVAILEYGQTHGSAHWIVFVIYGSITVLMARVSLQRMRGQTWISTFSDAILILYAIFEHAAAVGHPGVIHGVDEIVLGLAFLFLIQTGLRLQLGLVLLYAGTVASGWSLIIIFGVLSRSGIIEGHATPGLLGQSSSLMSFIASAALVMWAVRGVRSQASYAHRASRGGAILSKFLPKGIAASLWKGSIPAEVGNRHVCLLSVDIRGFSTMTSEQAIEATVATLMEFRRIVHHDISEEAGLVDKYIGDGALIVFLEGQPETQALSAIRAAEKIFNDVEMWTVRRVAENLSPVRIIITLHRGIVLAGIFDDGYRAEFSVIGAAMNSLSRIERRAKEKNLDVIASVDFLNLLPPHLLTSYGPKLVSQNGIEDRLPDVFSLDFSRAD